jgi:thioredoxin 1
MHEITKNDFDKKVLNNKKMVVVDFSGKDCQPCQRLKPVWEKVSKQYKDKEYIDFFTIEMKGNEEVFSKVGVMTIPHIIFFNEGKIVDELIGFKNEVALLEFLKKNIVELSKPEYFIE